MKSKILLLFLSMFLIIPFVSGGQIVTDTYDYGLTCSFPTTHFLKYDDGVLRVNCFTNFNNLTCVSKIYSMTNSTNYDEILQLNPDVISYDSISPFFIPENKQLNIYFNKKNLLLNNTFLYAVECSGNLGRDVYNQYVKVENNKMALNIAEKTVFLGNNISYYIMYGFMGLIIVIGLAFFISMWKLH